MAASVISFLSVLDSINLNHLSRQNEQNTKCADTKPIPIAFASEFQHVAAESAGQRSLPTANQEFQDRETGIGFGMTTKVSTRLPISYEKLEAFCRKWNIVRLELFGSVLRDDFDPKRSDVDVLVTFASGATPGFEYFSAEAELSRILGRPVEMTTRRTVEQSDNWIRREAILSEAQTVYEA